MSNLQTAFQRYVAAQAARVLTQMDRDPDSPTFGCFDRNFWHYKMRDFPSAVLQQGLFLLEALRQERVETVRVAPAVIEPWCLSAVASLARHVSRPGGLDEYYPLEHSYPAAAFGLYTVSRVLYDWRVSAPHLFESVQVHWSALRRLAVHVARRKELQAVNQQAAGLAGLAFANAVGLLDSRAAVEAHADRVLRAQRPEGWFDEYGGPDTGYLTVTLDALSDYAELWGDPRAHEAIDRSVGFLATLVGADGRLPSTLNSRNTDYVVPYGLVRAARRNPIAAWLVETLFASLDQPGHFLWATDDRYQTHYVFASVVRSLPHLELMQPPQAPSVERSSWLKGCGLWIQWAPDRQWTLYAAGQKGGLVRLHRVGASAAVDAGWRITRGSKIWVTNWWSAHWTVDQNDQRIRIRGRCQRAAYQVASPAKHLALRLAAWLCRDALIPILKRLLIFRPRSADGPWFERTVEFRTQGIRITDRIDALPGATAVPAPRQNVRHVASADSFSAEEWIPPLVGTGRRSLEKPLVVQVEWEPAMRPADRPSESLLSTVSR